MFMRQSSMERLVIQGLLPLSFGWWWCYITSCRRHSWDIKSSIYIPTYLSQLLFLYSSLWKSEWSLGEIGDVPLFASRSLSLLNNFFNAGSSHHYVACVKVVSCYLNSSLMATHMPIKCKHWTLVPLHSAHALKGYVKGNDVIIPRTTVRLCLVRCQNCVG